MGRYAAGQKAEHFKTMMLIKSILLGALAGASLAVTIQAQQGAAAGPAPAVSQAIPPVEARVPLSEPAVAFDTAGRAALAARLRSPALGVTPSAPLPNTRITVENRSAYFYNYVSGWITFYDAAGVRCGEGLFKLDALAAGETAETDTPDLRLTCTPTTWRAVAVNLLTRTSDTAKPLEPMPATTSPSSPPAPEAAAPPPRLRLDINGESHPIQLNNPVDLRIGNRTVRITLVREP